MTNYGKIKSYDSSKGRGTITPEQGGDALEFAKADLQQQAAEPKTGQRFGYDTKQVGDAHQATNLQQDRQQDQAKQQQG